MSRPNLSWAIVAEAMHNLMAQRRYPPAPGDPVDGYPVSRHARDLFKDLRDQAMRHGPVEVSVSEFLPDDRALWMAPNRVTVTPSEWDRLQQERCFAGAERDG